MDNISINKARATYYGLFSALVSFIENEDSYEKIYNTIDILSQNPLDEYSNNAFTSIKEFLEEKGYEGLKDENDSIFFSPSTAFIPLSASYYDECRDDGKKLIQMIDYVKQSKFRKNSTLYKDSEDNIGFILQFLNELIYSQLEEEKCSEIIIKEVFENILNNMIDDFIDQLYNHKSSNLYKHVAVLLTIFISVERSLLNITKPRKEKFVDSSVSNIKHEKKAFKQRAKRNLDEIQTL